MPYNGSPKPFQKSIAIINNVFEIYDLSFDVKVIMKYLHPIYRSHSENFVTKWDKMTDASGEKLFKPQTIISIENLKQHILTGCLSDIPPEGGTNRNERLHEHINKYFNRSRIGILLAYSLLHMILYAHNSSKIINGKRIICPIAMTHLKSTPDSIKLSTPIGVL